MVCSLSVKVIEERCSHVANILGYPSLKNEQKTVLANFVLGKTNNAAYRIWKESLLCLFAMSF